MDYAVVDGERGAAGFGDGWVHGGECGAVEVYGEGEGFRDGVGALKIAALIKSGGNLRRDSGEADEEALGWWRGGGAAEG